MGNTFSDDSLDIAMAVGYLVISRPFLDLTNQRHLNSTNAERLEVSMNEHRQSDCLVRLICFIFIIIIFFRKQYLKTNSLWYQFKSLLLYSDSIVIFSIVIVIFR